MRLRHIYIRLYFFGRIWFLFGMFPAPNVWALKSKKVDTPFTRFYWSYKVYGK